MSTIDDIKSIITAVHYVNNYCDKHHRSFVDALNEIDEIKLVDKDLQRGIIILRQKFAPPPDNDD